MAGLGEPELRQLEEFKRALEAEHEARFREEERRLDAELGEIVAQRRIEVEKEVARLRADQRRRARDLEESLKMELLREMRQDLAHQVQEMMAALESELFEELKTLRGTSRYELALDRLVRQGLELVGDRARVVVPRGESGLLRGYGETVLIEESDDLPDGGCLVIQLPGEDHVVDNSLRSRWERLVRELAKEISHRVTPFFDQLEEAL
jgi:vacuolar-type H+-ATPase subunit E/Vma4